MFEPQSRRYGRLEIQLCLLSEISLHLRNDCPTGVREPRLKRRAVSRWGFNTLDMCMIRL